MISSGEDTSAFGRGHVQGGGTDAEYAAGGGSSGSSDRPKHGASESGGRGDEAKSKRVSRDKRGQENISNFVMHTVFSCVRTSLLLCNLRSRSGNNFGCGVGANLSQENKYTFPVTCTYKKHKSSDWPN